VFKGGVLAETADNNGLTQLLGRTLLKGTQRRSAEAIAKDIESVGGSLDSYGGNNSFGVNAEVLSSDFTTGLDLLSDVLLHPTFPAAELEREREVQLAEIRAQKDHLLKSAGNAMRRTLFGQAGYGLDSLGTEKSLQRLKAADLKAFHQRLTAPNNCVLAVFGDVHTAQVRKAVEKAFADWKRTAALPGTPDSQFQVSDSPKHVTETRDKKQAVLVIGWPGVTLHHSDRFALELLQEACSDLGSRLFLRIREKLGLAYFVGAQNFLGLVPGCFAFYVGTAPERADLVEQELFAEAAALRAEGLTEEELTRAKAKIIGQKKIARQDLGTQAMTTALDELYGLGYQNWETEDARFEAVTREQTRAVSAKYLRPEAAVLAVVKRSA